MLAIPAVLARSMLVAGALCPLALAGTAFADSWPAESFASALNLTSVEGPAPNDFYDDLSGAVWNPATRRLWVVRNGPASTTSKLWVLRESGTGGWVVDEKSGLRGEWTGFGDLEDVTIASETEDVVYVMIEGDERIKEYDVSLYGTKTLRNDWNTKPYLPLSGGLGAEGLTFVPDAYLSAQGFVDRLGAPCTSHGGMGGLIFVGHQNGGGVFVFDLDRRDGSFAFVGEYRTSATETAALAFDRSTGFLYVWHDDDFDLLEKCRLTSTAVAGQSYRTLDSVRIFDGPTHQNNEGVAFFPAGECSAGRRPFFMTVDDGGANSLFEYTSFVDGCETLSAGKPGPGGAVQLRWSGGAAPYTLLRATNPGFKGSVVLVNRQNVSAYDDDVLNDGRTYFYMLE
jgi:hypothetical protein